MVLGEWKALLRNAREENASSRDCFLQNIRERLNFSFLSACYFFPVQHRSASSLPVLCMIHNANVQHSCSLSVLCGCSTSGRRLHLPVQAASEGLGTRLFNHKDFNDKLPTWERLVNGMFIFLKRLPSEFYRSNYYFSGAINHIPVPHTILTHYKYEP